MRFLLLPVGSLTLLVACNSAFREPEIIDECFDCCEDGFSDCVPPDIDPERSLPPLVQAETPPPPLSGGSLLVTGDRAIVADPDRDAVHLVSLASGEPARRLNTTVLEPGDEPGRVVEDGAGSYFVVLRGGGAIARFDGALKLMERYEVCSSPRGVAVFETTLYVACLEGDLVTIDTASGEELTRRSVGEDLRDVIVTPERVYVSHFRSASVSVFPREGDTEMQELVIPPVVDPIRAAMTPSVAYRMIQHDGSILVLHQLAAAEAPVQIAVSGGYGGVDCRPGIVQAAITVIEGTEIVNTTALGNLVLPVDVALGSVSEMLMIVAAGSRTDAPTSGGFAPSFRAPAVAQLRLQDARTSPTVPLGCTSGVTYDDGRRPTAVGFTDDGRAVVLTRAPVELHVLETDEHVDLPGRDVYDVGHELFFGDSGGGIACASCHAEGGDDGLVWTFEGIGPRRTLEIRGGILGSEPFHWDGDMADFRHLAQQVFSTRMLGPELPDEYADALAAYIDGLTVPAHGDHVDPLAAERGRAIFESAEAQCSVCHGGPRLSTPGTFDVGTGGAFQVPSLVGVGLRAPYIHNGCADTLEERFSPSCGGTAHGHVEDLAPEELDDLIAYLHSV